MTLPLVTRELVVVARRAVLVAAVGLYVALVAGFTLVWGLKLPMLTGIRFYDVLRVYHGGLLAIVMPWIVARCQAADRGDAVTALSALTARRPSSILSAKILSLAGVLILVVIAGAPATIVAAKMSAMPASIVFRDLLSACSLALLASAVTVAWTIGTTDVMTTWIGGAVTTMAVFAAAVRWTSAPVVHDLSLALVGLTVAAAVVTWSDRALQYCHD
jgi:hypothetical protein